MASTEFHADLSGFHFHEKGTLNPNVHVIRWHGQDCPNISIAHGQACKAAAALLPTYTEGRLVLNQLLHADQTQSSQLLEALRRDGIADESACWSDAGKLEVLMGYPRGYTALLNSFSHQQRVSVAVHVPALAVCLSAMLSHLPRHPEPAWSTPWEPWPKFQTSLLEGPSAREWFEDILSMLPLAGASTDLLQNTWEKFSSLDVEPFLIYETWCLSEGRPFKGGFEWEVLRAHDPARDANQKKQDFSADVPIDRHISAQEHLSTALSQHPLAHSPLLEQDLQFAIQNACQYGLQVARHRDVAFGHLRNLARALQSLDAHLLACRPVHHVDGLRPAMFAAVICILKWPDRDLPTKLVRGLELVGDIPGSHIFRPISSPPQSAVPLSGQDSQRYVDGLEKDLRVHPRAEVILEETEKEQSLGLAGPFRDRAYFDNLYGKEAWRPLKRHVIHQHDKKRPIDDGKAGRHNECSQLVETIVNQHADFPAAVLQFWAQTALRMLWQVQPEVSPDDLFRMAPWLQIAVGTDNMWKGLPLSLQSQRHLICL